ncbi:MAG: pilus assembly protein PilM [Candidatus Omnitrophota bacterium]
MKFKRFTRYINKLYGAGDLGSDFVCLDMGSRIIKACCVKKNLISDIYIEKNTNNVESAIELLKKNHLTSKRVQIAVKGPDTIIRYVTFPKIEKSGLREAFGYELSKYVPFPTDSLYYDIFILNENYSKDELLILLAVARKELIDGIIDAFEREKITVSGITLGGLALINLFCVNNNQDTNIALVDIGYSSILLNLLKKGIPFLSREIKISGKSIIERFSKSEDTDKETAEKKLIELNDPKSFTEIEGEILFELADEIRNSFDYFEMNTGEQIQEIYISGGFSNIRGVEETLSPLLGIKLKLWDPWENCRFDAKGQIAFPKEALCTLLGISI